MSLVQFLSHTLYINSKSHEVHVFTNIFLYLLTLYAYLIILSCIIVCFVILIMHKKVKKYAIDVILHLHDPRCHDQAKISGDMWNLNLILYLCQTVNSYGQSKKLKIT